MTFYRFLILLFVCASSMPSTLLGQEDEVKNWELGGYVKNLQSIYRLNLFGMDDLVQDNLLHNRLNFKFYPSDNITFKAELRNRIFYGKRSILLAGFDENAGNDYLDLSKNHSQWRWSSATLYD